MGMKVKLWEGTVDGGEDIAVALERLGDYSLLNRLYCECVPGTVVVDTLSMDSVLIFSGAQFNCDTLSNITLDEIITGSVIVRIINPGAVASQVTLYGRVVV